MSSGGRGPWTLFRLLCMVCVHCEYTASCALRARPVHGRISAVIFPVRERRHDGMGT